ncbi:MAG: hypothetical protein H0U05_05225 [Actinobacteria bacterium]|nr:hypothetical protein [Actinomycetota bacterium]
MTTQRFITVGSGIAIAGGVAFLVKLAVLAATNGAESIAVATFYLLGVVLCAVGSVGVALRLLQRFPRALRIIGAVVSPLAFFATFLLLDGVLVPPTREHLPNWAEVEAGVFLTALIWLAAGAWALRSERGLAVRTTQAAR